jgi:3-hydroxyacyl-[acyl-carrier-protein] dehydratase
MPIVPLADLASLDLSRVVVDGTGLERLLKQRGRMALVDGLFVLDVSGELVVGYKDIRADDWWAADHIPGRPLFPGALMVEASAQISTFDFLMRRPELENAFIGFTGIDATRFRAPVEPECRLVFVCRVKRLRRAMFTYQVQGWVDAACVFESEITGMVI